jgi:hydrogenase maturation protein HypF
MLERRINTPLTSSAGRLFDAAAAIAGVRGRVTYEGQAAMELEWLAHSTPLDGSYPFEITREAATSDQAPGLIIDTRPLVRALARDRCDGKAKQRIARRFHATLVEVIAAVCDEIRTMTGLDAVVLSGGVFMNALLSEEAGARLSQDRFRVFRHCCVPPNDGGLSLGQLAIAAASGGV